MFWKRRTYLDYAAGVVGNPSSPHYEGRRAKQMLEDARTAIARLVEGQSEDIIFTSGATEANALAILGVVRSKQQTASSKQKIHALYLPSAHASVVENMKLLAEEEVEVEELPIKNYRVDTEALAKMLRGETVLVSMDAVCGETGVVWNTCEVADVLKKFRTGTLKKESARAARPIQHSFFSVPVLHVDASQAPLTEKITRAHFGADLLTFEGSKVGPPVGGRGIGALIVHRTIPLEPLYRGGGQERGLRPGSEAPELAERFATALDAAARGRESFRARAEADRALLVKRVMASVSGACVNEGRRQTPNILNFSFPGRDTDYLAALLDEEGFAVSTRSACETDSEEGSRAVLALASDQQRALSTLRISWGPGIRPDELRRFAERLLRAVQFIDKNSHGQHYSHI